MAEQIPAQSERRSGPFIITVMHTTPPVDLTDPDYVSISRRAVATLDGREVYNALYETPLRDKLGVSEMIAALPDSGGTIHEGDGTVIEVEQRHLGGVDGLLNLSGLGAGIFTEDEIIAAYNVREGS